MKKINKIAILILVVVMSFSLSACGEFGKIGRKSFDDILNQAFINIGQKEIKDVVIFDSNHSIQVKAGYGASVKMVNTINNKLNILIKFSQMSDSDSKTFGDTTISWYQDGYKTIVKYANEKVDFHKLLDECFVLIGNDYCEGGYVDIGSDDSFMAIDTNPRDIKDGSTYLAFKLVDEINSVLGLPESLDNEMNHTSYNDGKQTKEFDKFTVSWKYHPDRGLEVTYTRK